MRAANFVEETTTSIAGTSGNGAVTLTAIANVPRFSTVFGTQATAIRYVIEDTANKKFEVGLGFVASNVLTRSNPQITWDGTTYNDQAPSALQFGSSPASGAIKIRMAATAESQAPIWGAVQTDAATSDPNWREYAVSPHMSNFGGLTNGYGSLWSNQAAYIPYLMERSGRLTGIRFNCASATASNFVKVGIYSMNHATGLPGRLIVEIDPIDCTTTGIKTNTNNGLWTPSGAPFLTPGWYFIAVKTAIAGSSPVGKISSVTVTNRVSPLGRNDNYGFVGMLHGPAGAEPYASAFAQEAPATGYLAVNPAAGGGGVMIFGLRVQP